MSVFGVLLSSASVEALGWDVPIGICAFAMSRVLRATAPPIALEDLPVVGRLVVAELLLAYQQSLAAAEQIRTAVEWGAVPRAYWLVRLAQICIASDQENSARVDEILAEAEQIDAAYPLVKAMKLFRADEWDEMLSALEGWEPLTPWESDTARTFRCAALVELGRLDEAIVVFDGGITETGNTGNLLQLAKLLLARAVQGTGDSRLADAARAVEIGIRARNLRRVWRGDSAEAVTIAAEAAVLAEDSQQVWTLTRPAPDGQATEAEATDARVLPVAAISAALTGRFTQARDLVDAAPDGYIRQRIEAEIASANPVRGEGSRAVEAWQATLEAAPTDNDKLHALRGLAMEGVTDHTALES